MWTRLAKSGIFGSLFYAGKHRHCCILPCDEYATHMHKAAYAMVSCPSQADVLLKQINGSSCFSDFLRFILDCVISPVPGIYSVSTKKGPP